MLKTEKRDKLKEILLSKFKGKYGDKPALSKYIDNEVARFINGERLTEKNLKMLDHKISKEAYSRDKKNAILEDVKSQRSASVRLPSVHSRAAAANGEADIRSRYSGASHRSKVVSNRFAKDTTSLQSDVFSEIAEDDEWAAI